MTTTTVRAYASLLRDLLAPVAPLADQDGDTLPILSAVRVTYGDGYLFATATDRYKIGVQRARVVTPGIEYDPDAFPIMTKGNDEPTLDVNVPLDVVRSLLKLYRVTKVANPLLVLTFDSTEPARPNLVVTSLAPTADGFIGTTRWALLHAEYPRMGALFDQFFTGEPKSAESVNLDLKHLAAFGAARTLAGFQVPMQFFHGARKDDGAGMVGVRIGHDFVGAVAGVRSNRDRAGDQLPTRELDEDWGSVITAARKAVAS